MRRSYTPQMVHMSYWEFFQHYYTPKLAEMDLTLKTIEAPIPVAEAGRILGLRSDAIKKIMAQKAIQQLDHEGLIQIIMHGKSSLCQLLQREFKCGSPDQYSPENIAYIYGLQSEHVQSVCHQEGYEYVPAESLPAVLSKLYIYILQ